MTEPPEWLTRGGRQVVPSLYADGSQRENMWETIPAPTGTIPKHVAGSCQYCRAGISLEPTPERLALLLGLPGRN